MAVSKILRSSLYVVGGLIALALLTIAVLAFLRIPIDLSSHKGLVESTASFALGRTVKVDDRIVITTSLRPTFIMEGLRIENPKGFAPGDFLKMDAVRLQVKLLPLLLRKIQIDEIRVKGLSVYLVKDEKGAGNWMFQREPVEPKTEAEPETGEPSKDSPPELTSDSFVLTDLALEDISVSYRSPKNTEPLRFTLSTCTGQMVPGEPFDLSMKGMLLKEPFTTRVRIGSLQEFLEKSTSWMNIETDIAKTRFNFTGRLDLAGADSSLKLKTSVSGERLESLNGMLHLDLPPIHSYRATADLTLRKKMADFSNLSLQIGESRLDGTMSVDTTRSKLKSAIDLNAPMIQLNDFELGGWSPDKKNGEELTTQKEATEVGSEGEQVKKLLSPEVLERIDVRMNVTAERVLSGKDELGSGSLTATVKEGLFSADPVKLNIPGGSFVLATTLRPDPKAPQASVRAVMKNFDFGVLVRRVSPKAEMGGSINLDVELTSSAESFERLMANGNGYFDYSGRLENIKAGIIDLWAVNLIAAIVSREEDSRINCVIGRWTLKEGVLTPDVFLIDTSKIRICGKGQADFKNDRIDLRVTSRPKRAEFFNLATPIEIHGNVSQFGIGIPPGGLIGTVVKFVTSPVHVPIRRLLGGALPADGEDVCGMTIGPDNRSGGPPPGCK